MNIDDAHARKLADMLEAIEHTDDAANRTTALGLVGAVLVGHIEIVGVDAAGELKFRLTPAGIAAAGELVGAEGPGR